MLGWGFQISVGARSTGSIREQWTRAQGRRADNRTGLSGGFMAFTGLEAFVWGENLQQEDNNGKTGGVRR